LIRRLDLFFFLFTKSSLLLTEQVGFLGIKVMRRSTRKAALSMSSFTGRTAVLVDQHPLWLDAVEPILDDLGFAVVGKVTSARDGLALVEEHRPDVLITEILALETDIDGIELVRRSIELVPTVRAIILSVYHDTKHIEAALGVGAVAYVIKTAHPEDLRSAIRQAFAHSVYLPSGRPQTAAVERGTAKDDLPDLTRRELEILRLVAEGYSNTQLAKMLWVTEQTIKFHLSNVYRKLDVANRTEASRWAQLHGLLGREPVQTQQSIA
jgi:DNA-binding NarL/FixJ family response regulator